jgi:hypothetical protein
VKRWRLCILFDLIDHRDSEIFHRNVTLALSIHGAVDRRRAEGVPSAHRERVVYFDRDAEGDLKAGDAMEATNATAAERAARSLSHIHGTVAFSRIGDPATGEFQDAVILARWMS